MPERGRPRKPVETPEEKRARLANELTDGRRLVSIEAAALFLGISPRTIYGGTCKSKDKPPISDPPEKTWAENPVRHQGPERVRGRPLTFGRWGPARTWRWTSGLQGIFTGVAPQGLHHRQRVKSVSHQPETSRTIGLSGRPGKRGAVMMAAYYNDCLIPKPTRKPKPAKVSKLRPIGGAELAFDPDHKYAHRQAPKYGRVVAAVYRRDHYTCRACGLVDTSGRRLTPHHGVPRADGGEDTLENMYTLCDDCHALVEQGLVEVQPCA